MLRILKRSLQLIIIIVTPFACAKETQNSPEDPLKNTIKVIGADASAGSETKTTLDGFVTSWVAGDKVGIYSPQARPSVDGAPGVPNLAYTAQSSAAVSDFAGQIYWGTGAHDFCAYYPHTAGTFIAAEVPVSVPAEQTQVGESSAHLSTYDMMIANPIANLDPGTENNPAVVNLRFNHVFALLDFRIASITEKTIKEVELVAPEGTKISISGDVNIASATPAPGVSYAIGNPTGTNKVKVTITGNLDPTNDYNTTPGVFMMVNPGNYTGQTFTINIKTNDDVVYTQTRSGTEFKRGTRYLVKFNDELGANPVGLDGVANCYIINPRDLKTTFTFPITQSNNYWSVVEYGNVPDNVIDADDNWVASVIWQDRSKLVTLVDGGKGTGSAGQVKVLVDPGKYGNVLVGIKRDSNGDGTPDEGASYLWSWHLWITNYNPNDAVVKQAGVYAYPVTGGNVHRYRDSTAYTVWEHATYTNSFIMDRFLGAESTNTPYADEKGSYGVLHYQFGRKDPFPTLTSMYDGSNSVILSPITLYSGTVTKNVANQNPTQFVYGSSNWWSDAPTTNTRWQDHGSYASSKPILDPCPPGWRVAPTNLLWNDFNADKLRIDNMGSPPHMWTYTRAGANYPAYGFRNYSDGQIFAVGWQSTVWSAYAYYDSGTTSFNGAALVTNVDGAPGSYTNNVSFMNFGPRSFGFAIRCVK
ncbi:MAG TPA: hypothetical protein DEO54_07915 [Rikenellaceae bacterium]|nr:MAG: hypothetical protein A2X20_02165 [Bacteroidetes bacterium GWE2_40_15]HBZ26148.1 hypothetical protein [Rikenellaceae bacterium]